MAKKVGKSSGGTLIIIGGHEKRRGEMRILEEVAKYNAGSKLVVTTVASHTAASELWNEYREAFQSLGVKSVKHLDLTERPQSTTPKQLSLLKDAKTVFFTGGDQLRITSVLGGTPMLDAIRKIYQRGGVIAGTSAGASAISQTMLLSGRSAETPRLEQRLGMAPGLGFLKDAIVDQHFAERGRIGRLLGAVALNPSDLGIGIDEDTSLIVEGKVGRVLGSGGVYIVDASGATNTNVSDGTTEGALSLFDIRLHVLSNGDKLNLEARIPEKFPAPR